MKLEYTQSDLIEVEEEAYKRGYDQGQKDILEEMRQGKQRAIFNNGTECRMITEVEE